jgi:hypothetical protein
MDRMVESKETKKQYYIEKKGEVRWEKFHDAEDYEDAMKIYKRYIKGNGCTLRVMRKITTTKIEEIKSNG